MKRSSLPALLFTFIVLATSRAEVKLPPLFSDHLVLQRAAPVPVWGTAEAGEEVTVEFAGQRKSAVAETSGKWRVKLEAMDASAKPRVLTVRGKNTLNISDVLVGEVWLGAGQSNMQMPGSAFIPGAKTGDLNLNKSPGDAHLLAAIQGGPYPEIRLITSGVGGWQESTPENLLKFSAQLQSFGLRLQEKLGVPVGLMVAAVGGTPSGRWLTPEAIAQDAACQQVIATAREKFSPEAEQKNYRDALQKYERDLAAWNQLPEAQKAAQRAPGKPKPIVPPGEIEGKGAIGDLHDTYLQAFIGYGLRGVLWDQGESGTAVSALDQATLMDALIRSWRREWGQGDFPFLCVQKPSGQGCAFDDADPWFGWASDPFLPLPANVPNDARGVELYLRPWLRIANDPHTFLVPSSDLGSGLHPWNKSGYGERGARVALGVVYGEKIETSGPVYASHQVKGGTVTVRFSHAGQGLVFRHGERLQGFMLAGADRKFAWAEALIAGDTVVLSSPQISQPVFARYAWSVNRGWANLFNQDGLPALPFRTDAENP